MVRKIGAATKFAKLDDVNGVDMKGFAEDPIVGFTIRFVRAFDIQRNQWPCFLDAILED
jgi:hypothetical protein